MPVNSANFFPLKPLRSNSSSRLSRPDAGVRTRPFASVLSICPTVLFVSVVTERYDVDDLLE